MSFFQTPDPYYNFSEEVVDIRSFNSNRVVTLTYNPTSGQYPSELFYEDFYPDDFLLFTLHCISILFRFPRAEWNNNWH